MEEDERLTDITYKGDTLVVAGRSRLYLAVPPYNHFRPLQVKSPEGYDGKVSLFRTIWNLSLEIHAGRMVRNCTRNGGRSYAICPVPADL